MGDLLFLKKGSNVPLIVHNPIDSRTYATENWHPHHHYLNISGWMEHSTSLLIFSGKNSYYHIEYVVSTVAAN